VLRLPVGDSMVMSEQLHHLLRMSVRPYLSLRVVPAADGIAWRTSSYSAGHGGCVEVAPAPDGVLVRDSKDRDGPALTVTITAWQAFRTTVTR